RAGGIPRTPGRSTPSEIFQRLQPHEDLPGLRAIGWPEDPGLVELIDDPRGSPVADAEAALQTGGRALLELDADLGGVADDVVADLGCGGLPLVGGLGLVGTDHLEDILLDARRLPIPLSVPRHQALCILCGQVGALDPDRVG